MTTCRGIDGKATLSADGFVLVQTSRKHRISLNEITAIYVQRKSVMQPGAAATILALSLLSEQFVLMGWVQVPIEWSRLVTIQQLLIAGLLVSVAFVAVRVFFRNLVIERAGSEASFKLRFVPSRHAREFAENIRQFHVGKSA